MGASELVPVQRERRPRAQLMDGVVPFQDLRVPLEKDVEPRHRDMYYVLSGALQRYCKHEPEKAILLDLKTKHGVLLKNGDLWRLHKRSQTLHPKDGVPVGLWACIPGWRPKGRPDDPSDTRSGKQLTQFFRKYPAIEAALCLWVIGKERPELSNGNKKDHETAITQMTPHAVWEEFTRQCRLLGLHKKTDWPYDTVRFGREAVRLWYHAKKYLNPSQAARNEMGREAGDLVKRDYRRLDQKPMARSLRLAYERVEMDEHKMDAMFTAVMPLLNGQFRAVSTRRLWALVLVECECRLALASTVAYGGRYNSADVMRLVRNVFTPPPRYGYRLQDPEYRYREGACWPSELPQLARNSCQNLALDSDSVHLSDAVRAAIRDVTKAHRSAERVGEKEGRPNIEGFFPKLVEMCRHLPSATGNSTDSPARRDPEGAAEHFLVSMPFAEELLDIRLRNHNVTAQACLGGLSPIQKADQMIREGRFFRCPLGEFGPSNLHLLLPAHRATLRELRGGSTSTPLVVQLKGAIYTGSALNRDRDLRFAPERDVAIYVQEDARLAFVVPDAFPERLYRVALTGRYASAAHTLLARQLTEIDARHRTDSDRARNVNVMLAAAHAFQNLPGDDAAKALMLGEMATFVDRAMRGEVGLVDTIPGQAQEEIEEANHLVGYSSWQSSDAEDTHDGPEQERVAVDAAELPPAQPSSPGSAPPLTSGATAPQAEQAVDSPRWTPTSDPLGLGSRRES